MSVRTDDGRGVSFDLKDYDRIDHGYAATVHKAQGMTVDRTHILATPGMDAHSSYVALSRHRDGMDLHYGRDDFASQDRLVNTLSRDRANDMASDYEQIDPAQDYAERRGITFRARVAEITRKLVPERLRDAVDGMLDGLRSPGDGMLGADAVKREAERQGGEDPENALRRARGRALIHQSGVSRHLRILHDAGFVSMRPDGQRRLYSLKPEPFRELDNWLATYRELWEARLDRFGAVLEARQNAAQREER